MRDQIITFIKRKIFAISNMHIDDPKIFETNPDHNVLMLTIDYLFHPCTPHI